MAKDSKKHRKQRKESDRTDRTTKTDDTQQKVNKVSGHTVDKSGQTETMSTQNTQRGNYDKSTRATKRRRRSTGGTYDSSQKDTENTPEKIAHDKIKEDFKKLSMDNKLVALFEMMAGTKSDTKILRNKVEKLEGNIGQMKNEHEKMIDRIQVLEYRSIDLEARSRRSNLIFRGHQEVINENCEEIIESFIKVKLGLDTINIKVNRAHRIGAPNRGKDRPIIVSFVHFKDTENILDNAYKLKGTKFGINRDYPKEITEARSKLWPLYKQAKDDRSNKVYIGYPAKLIVNKKVVRDEFPDWTNVMRQSRIGHDQNTKAKPSETRTNYKNTEAVDKGQVLTTQNTFETLMEINTSESESENEQESDTDTEDPQEEETDVYSQSMIQLERNGHRNRNRPNEPINLSQSSGACGGPGDTSVNNKH